MKTRISAFAFVALAAFAYAPALHAAGPTSLQISNTVECTTALADTREAQSSNPTLGDKSAKAFEEIFALAEQRCADNQFANAADLLNIARGMVASE